MAAIDALRAGAEQYLREMAESSPTEFRALVESVQPPMSPIADQEGH